MTERDAERTEADADVLLDGSAPEGTGLLLAVCMAGSRILGLARDMALAWLLGAGPAADALAAALRPPHVLRRLLAEGSLSMTISAALTRMRTEPEAARSLARALLSRLALACAILAAGGLILAPILISVLAPGLDGACAEDAVLLLRICAPHIAAAGMAAGCMAVLHARGEFLLPAVSPAIFNVVALCFIGLAALGVGSPTILPAAGVACAGCVQWLVMAAGARRHVNPAPAVPPRDAASGAWRLLARAPIGVVGAAAPQAAGLAAAACASFGAPGSLAALHYAERILELPLGLTGVCIGMAGLPRWSVLAAGNRREELAASLADAVRPALALGLAAAAGLAAVGRETVDLLLGHGAFDADAARAASLALFGFLPGLPACAAARPLLAACNAADDGRAAAAGTMLAVIVALAGGAAGVALVPPESGPFAPALAVSAGMWAQLILLRRAVRRMCGDAPLLPAVDVTRAVAAATAAGITAWITLNGVHLLIPRAGGLLRGGFLLAAVAAGGAAWIATLWFAGDGDIRRLADRIFRKRVRRER